MKRVSILLFGVVVYAVFFATFLYLIAFVGNLQVALGPWLPSLPALVPHSVDIGGAQSAPVVAAIIDLALILCFGLQHSVMARTGFKAWLKRHLPESAERSIGQILTTADAAKELHAEWINTNCNPKPKRAIGVRSSCEIAWIMSFWVDTSIWMRAAMLSKRRASGAMLERSDRPARTCSWPWPKRSAAARSRSSSSQCGRSHRNRPPNRTPAIISQAIA